MARARAWNSARRATRRKPARRVLLCRGADRRAARQARSARDMRRVRKSAPHRTVGKSDRRSVGCGAFGNWRAFFFRFQFQPTFDSSLARIAALAPALSDLGAIRSAASLPRWREEKYRGASRGPDAHSPARKTHVSPARQAPRSPRPPRTALTAPRPHRAPNAPPPRRRTRPREKRKRCWP